jgi:hypothetical protein
MDITGIFAISGKPGLFKSIAQSKHGVIVESLTDGKRFNAYTTYKVSALEDITVFSVDEDITLLEVFTKIAENENYKAVAIADSASKEELRKYFASVVPNYDADRVYDSDIKKIIKWYNQLHQNNRIKPVSEAKEEVKEEVAKAEEKPAKAPKAAKPKAAKEPKAELAAKEAKPTAKKKAPAKKKAE